MTPDNRKTTWRFCLAAGLAHAVMLVLAFPPYDLWGLAPISLLPLTLLALRSTSRFRAVFATWLSSAAVWLWPDRWLIDVTPPGYPLLACLQAAYPAAFVWLIGSLSRLRRKAWGSDPDEIAAALRPNHPRLSITIIPAVLLVPICWVGLEMLEGSVLFGGYPWYMLGHPLINAPVLCQSADLLGTYFISFLAAMPAGLIADLITRSGRKYGRWSRSLLGGAILWAVIQCGAILYGLDALRRMPGEAQTARTFTIAALQTNIPQDNKLQWTIEQQFNDFDHFAAMTRRWHQLRTADGRQGVDLIVWPETMIGGDGLNPETVKEIQRFENEIGFPATLSQDRWGTSFDTALKALARELGVPLLVGSTATDGLKLELETFSDPQGRQLVRRNATRTARYNSSFLYLPDGTQSPQRYDKLHLTPFGEVMPYIHRWPRLQSLLLSLGAGGMSFDLSRGTAPTRFNVPFPSGTITGESTGMALPPDRLPGSNDKAIRVCTPICFESTMSNVCRSLLWDNGRKMADILINLTNDGWFGSTPGGRAQHLQIGRFRCIENRVPMVRAANTGISAAIDSAGRLLQVGPNDVPGLTPAWSEGIMTATLTINRRPTLFGVIGDTFGWICLAATCVLAGVGLRTGWHGMRREPHR